MYKKAINLFFLIPLLSIGQTDISFDNLNANPLTNKSITWTSSNYGDGFGHRIVNTDPGGITLLNFQGRNNSTTWSNIISLTSSGDVGVGTDNPFSKFHVYNGSSQNSPHSFADLSVEDDDHVMVSLLTNTAKTAYYAFGDTDDDFVAGLQYNHANDMMLLRVNNHASDIAIDSDGKVGIGTDSPTHKLHVAGNILGNRILLNDPTATTDWNTVWQSGFFEGYNVSNAPESPGWFWGINLNHSSNNSSNRYNGQIVIKNSPSAPIMYFRSTNSAGIGTWAKVVHSEGNQFINGNLGIGTTSIGSYKLSVNGNVRAKEIKVETGWADYVFKEGYDLPTLEEVEKHINEKGHLINIPSAKEVEENGIQLGEMNMKLLEKIEELTLYTLEQEKEIQALRAQYSEIVEESKKIVGLNERLQRIEQQLNNKK